jgi:hypothetical protein
VIDIGFDFTTDAEGYWDGFWDRNDGLGMGGADPDMLIPTLRNYHQILWSKELPNGQKMDLKQGKWADYDYLVWNGFRLASDSIIVGFRYQKYKTMMEKIFERVGDYKAYFEDLIRKSYSIGGTIIFPKHPNSMNQAKGRSTIISDRWDLTLECIRRYYEGEESPLYETILSDKDFFGLFVDFKGYVDFFFLQDCVSLDYSSVDIWCGDSLFQESGLPKTVDEYLDFIDREFLFLKKRNERIRKYCQDNGI